MVDDEVLDDEELGVEGFCLLLGGGDEVGSCDGFTNEVAVRAANSTGIVEEADDGGDVCLLPSSFSPLFFRPVGADGLAGLVDFLTQGSIFL